jgi:hypothetical protein
MWLLDQWAERHILDAQKKVSLRFPGTANRCLDDDSHVPPELRGTVYSKMRAVFLLNLSSAKKLLVDYGS